MKSKVVLIAIMLATATMLQSCNSCENKKDIPPGTTPEVSSSETSLPTDADYVKSDASMSANASSGGNSSNGTTTKSSTQTSGGQDGKATSKSSSKNKYSAPDGTDAENNDGDYYTRNDTAGKPTGSIK